MCVLCRSFVNESSKSSLLFYRHKTNHRIEINQKDIFKILSQKFIKQPWEMNYHQNVKSVKIL